MTEIMPTKKISELIQYLQEILEKHGDLPVYISREGYYDDWDIGESKVITNGPKERGYYDFLPIKYLEI